MQSRGSKGGVKPPEKGVDMIEIKTGDKFYDERNDMYITVDDESISNRSAISCITEELGDDLEYSVTGRQLFTEYELSRFKRVG